jgi:hypothetical protein
MRLANFAGRSLSTPTPDFVNNALVLEAAAEYSYRGVKFPPMEMKRIFRQPVR